MDAKGGHFRQVGAAYRRNVSLRSAQRKRDYAQAFDTAEAKAIGTTLKFDDFVPMMLEPWRAACSEDRHRTALRVVGVRPTFTMGPAYRIRAEEQRLAAIESELTTVNLAADQNDRVVEGLEGLKSAVIEEVRTKGKRGKNKRVAAAARAIRTNGGAGVSSSSSSTSSGGGGGGGAPAEAAGGGPDTTGGGGIGGSVDGSGVARSQKKRRKTMTQDEKVYAAGVQSIKNCPHIEVNEKRRLLALAKKNGTFSNMRSGGVFEHFAATPTGPAYRAWTAAVEAKEMAIAADSVRLATQRKQKQAEKIAAEKARCVSVRARLVAAKWTDEAIKSCTKADLVALLRVAGGCDGTIKLGGTGMKKSTLVTAGQPFFQRMRSALPRPRRTTAGQAAGRLGDD